jgi:hypothetical protein
LAAFFRFLANNFGARPESDERPGLGMSKFHILYNTLPVSPRQSQQLRN